VLANSPVLVLNQSYEPLNICHAKRALALIMAGRAEMLEMDAVTSIPLPQPMLFHP